MVKWYGTIYDYDKIHKFYNEFNNKFDNRKKRSWKSKLFKKKKKKNINPYKIDEWNYMLFLKKMAEDNLIEFEKYSKKNINIHNMRIFSSSIQNLIPIQEFLLLLKKKVKNLTFISLSNNYKEEEIEYLFKKTFEYTNKINYLPLPCKVIYRGELFNSDLNSKYVNSTNGLRKTFNLKENDNNDTIRYHFFGTSEIFGSHLKDTETLPSSFSKLINDDHVCLNHGLGGVNLIDVIFKIYNYNFSEKDRVFMCLPFYYSNYSDISIDTSEKDMLDYIWHLNEQGSIRAANKLYEKYQKKIENNIYKYDNDKNYEDILNRSKNLLDLYNKLMLTVEANKVEQKEIIKYQNYLRNNSFKTSNKDKIGSVCVNCNPITLGHLSLLKYASKNVDYLYIFVLDPYDANKESVKFVDRLNMVKLACKNFSNTKILEGGKYMCTAFICPEYFDKDNQQGTNVNFNLESFYFCRYIAPILNIKTIFLGDEPYCKLTNSYNQHMINNLPKYNIEVEIMPRVNGTDDTPISASKIRKAIRNNNWEYVIKNVPLDTIEYLKNNVAKYL